MAGALAVTGLISHGTPLRRTQTAASAARTTVPRAVPPPDWKRCTGLPDPPPDTGTPPAGFRCASLKVPLDYADPSGRKIDIALVKVPAADPRHRIGSLLFNFGGPARTASARSPGSPASTPNSAPATTWSASTRAASGGAHR